MNIKIGYSYDDVLLVPKYSEIQHRADVDLTIDWGKNIKTLPIVSANMKHVVNVNLANTLANLKVMSLLHRFESTEERINSFKQTIHNNNYVGISIGAVKRELDIFDKLFNEFGNDIKIICIDIAHGHSKICIDAIKHVKGKYPDCLLIAGNVATDEGAYDLWNNGADVVKCGIGPSTVCSTRIETGNGYPQLSALENIYSYFKNFPNRPKIIADGGLSKVGNIVKALCLSDGVMLGNMLAGTEEGPGDIIIQNNKKYKAYAGSSTLKKKNIEGYSGLVPFKGSVNNVIQRIKEGLQSGCSYQGVNNVKDLRNNPEFVLLTNSGIVESGPHDILLKG